MFRRIITALYKKYCSPANVVNMTRIQMLGVSQVPEVLDLPLPERKQIAEEAQTLLQSAVLKLAVDTVKTRVMRHIQNEAPTAEIIFYDRFTINGVCLVEDELNSYANMFSKQDETEDEEF